MLKKIVPYDGEGVWVIKITFYVWNGIEANTFFCRFLISIQKNEKIRYNVQNSSFNSPVVLPTKKDILI